MANLYSFHGALAYCYKMLGDDDAFIAQLNAFELSLAAIPENKHHPVGVDFVRGQFYALSGEIEKAEAIAKTLLAQNLSIGWMVEKDPIYRYMLNWWALSINGLKQNILFV